MDLQELLRPLSEADLGGAPGVDVLRRRASERARRARRRRVVLVALIAVFGLVGVIGVATSSDDPARVDTLGPGEGERDQKVPTRPDPASGASEPLPVGRFPYDMVADDAELWVLDRLGNEVVRISTEANRIVSRTALPKTPFGSVFSSTTRLAMTTGAIWVAGVHADETGGGVARIDRTAETLSVVPLDLHPSAIAVRGGDIWVAGSATEDDRRITKVALVDGAGSRAVRSFRLDTAGVPVDIAVTRQGLWVQFQAGDGPNPLVLVDPEREQVIAEVPIEHPAVRLVATDDVVVVGSDTSGLGGRSGALTMVDPETSTVIATEHLDVRPEAIVLLDDVILTTGVRAFERRDLTEVPVRNDVTGGFAMAASNDRIWWTKLRQEDQEADVHSVAVDDLLG